MKEKTWHAQAAKQWIALCDCNNFFVSCERIFRPQLRGTPVVVLSSNDGCIVSRSNEAKALGIAMGAPYFPARHFLEGKGVAVFSGNLKFYGEVSGRVMRLLKEFSDAVEVYSIDEAFLSLPSAASADLPGYAEKMRTAILRATGIPLSVGIARSKTLAKLAADAAKKIRQGICLIGDDAQRRQFLLAGTPIQDVWGIGRKSARMLESYGVKNAADFVGRDLQWIRKKCSLRGAMTALELQGYACLRIEEEEGTPKSIQVSYSFGQEIERLDELEKPVIEHAVSAAVRLRRFGLAAGEIGLNLRVGYHGGWYQYFAAEETLDPPVSSDIDIVRSALRSLHKMYRRNQRYTKAGIALAALGNAAFRQQNIFEDDTTQACRKKRARLDAALDTINAKLGKNAIAPAALAAKVCPWRPRGEMRSDFDLSKPIEIDLL